MQPDVEKFNATSLEARDIKIKITNIDIPVSFASAFEGEIIRRPDMQVEVDGSRVDCFELVHTKEAAEIEDHKITVIGPEIDEIPVGSKISMSYTVDVAGKAMQPDFESVMERKFHSYLNCIEGVMHTGQRDMIRIRISKADFEAGFQVPSHRRGAVRQGQERVRGRCGQVPGHHRCGRREEQGAARCRQRRVQQA